MTQSSCLRGAATLTTMLTLLVTATPAHAATATGASANAQARCQIKNATFKAPGGDAYSSGGMSGEERTYICAYSGGHAVEIGHPGNPEASSEGGVGPAVQRLAFAGETAGVAYTDEEGARELRVVDLADGHTHSLTLTGSTLHWRSYGGARHSAVLG